MENKPKLRFQLDSNQKSEIAERKKVFLIPFEEYFKVSGKSGGYPKSLDGMLNTFHALRVIHGVKYIALEPLLENKLAFLSSINSSPKKDKSYRALDYIQFASTRTYFECLALSRAILNMADDPELKTPRAELKAALDQVLNAMQITSDYATSAMDKMFAISGPENWGATKRTRGRYQIKLRKGRKS